MDTVLTTVLSRTEDAQAEGIPAARFDEIIRQHQKRVYRVLFLATRDSDIADALTQECFLRAFRKRHTFRGECRVDTWLLRIAVNLARDHVKNRRNRFWRKLVGLEEVQDSPGPLTAGQPSAERSLLAREELDAVWATVALLPPQQRMVFLLRFAEEMSLAEIAQVLDLKLGSVKAHLFRALATVRRHMKEQQWR